ncbi:Rna-binding kh domain-containing protein rcf3 [Thalictrum thalictroides]|uniref:Rna-binding kh domain-containing protein rcf3 n=1 Tax=Thalictrum thalictroides TaxID=46969 RepID=A0A7J6VEM3_THATH|nr:Rna-binding kh domain-containing protein rcf3 [Thalictrum thalictroides]
MQDDSTTTTTNGGPKRRIRLPPLSNSISSGNIAYRLLCHVSKSGAVIGKSGNIVKLLEQETGATIRIENPVPRCDERVITVIAPTSPKKIIILKSSNKVVEKEKDVNSQIEEENGREEDVEEVEVEIFPAQHGLIRVYERVLEAEAEDGLTVPTYGKRLVTCRMLTDSSQIGYLMGKGGKNINKIEEDSGSKIRVSKICPACALPNDELIQIAGDSLAVKKAVLAVSQCLQNVGTLDNAQMVGSRPFMAAPNGAFSNSYTEFPPHQVSFQQPTASSSMDYASRTYSTSAEQELVFRLICSEDKIGGVIGKGGSIIKALQNETGASIRVAGPVAESDDRVITVSALEGMESQYSPAQNALIRVFTRSTEVGNGKRLESDESKDSVVEARLLVPSHQVGCVIGKGGTVISEIRRASRTNMWVINDQVPSCAQENDTVVRIIGKIQNVQDSLSIVTGKLRDALFPNKITTAAGRVREPTHSDPSHRIGRQTSLTESLYHLGLSNHLDHSPSPKIQTSRYMTDSGRGVPPLRDGLEHFSGSNSAVVTNTTLEILVPEHAIGYDREEKESKLNRLRQISGAKVRMHEPLPGKNEATVIISGTPDQTQAAQSILHAFILGSGGS